MIIGFIGVVIGALIGLAGSLLVETIRAKNAKIENAKRYRIEVFEKRKATLLTILELIRQLQIELHLWKLAPANKDNARDRLNSLTVYMPHLAILPRPVSGFISDWIEEIGNIISPSPDALGLVNLSHDHLRKLVHCSVELTKGVSTVIEMMDAEIMSMTPSQDYVFFERIAKSFNSPADKEGNLWKDPHNESN